MRIPSFNDFSPGILEKAYGKPDIRRVLAAVNDNEGDKEAVVATWAKELFAGKKNKRSSVNVPATLHGLGLLDRENWILTEIGQRIAREKSIASAVKRLARHLLTDCNGQVVVDAVQSLLGRGDQVSKESLQRELKRFGVAHLSNGTTDHTTHLNWLVQSGALGSKPNYTPNEKMLKRFTGLATEERDGFYSKPLAQQVFLSIARSCLLYTSPSPRDVLLSRMPSSA